jgi:hypothetical protein
MDNFKIATKSLDIGDNIAITYEGNFTPIKINGKVEERLKHFKGSYCIYELQEDEYFNNHPVEILVLEEFSDSPYSIYINNEGEVESYEFINISTIEIGSEILLEVIDNRVIGFKLLHKD